MVAGVQNPLSLLFCQAVRHLAGAAFTAIQTVPVTRKLATPTLQGAQPHPKQLGQFAGPGDPFQALFQDLQSPPAIIRRRQASPSSPQRAWIFFAANSKAAASAKALSFRRSSCCSRLISR